MDTETPGLRPPSKRPAVAVGLSIIVAALLAAAAWQWWPRRAPPPVAPPPVATAPPAVEAPTPPAEPAAAPEPKATALPLTLAELGRAFTDALGAKAMTWLLAEDFPRRFVATVDNLDREFAPSLAWPVEPTPGRFGVMAFQGRTVINPDNAARYAPLLHWFEGIDNASAVALYARMLPLLQATYEELGFPRRRFHTRLLAIIEHLLAAPEAPEPIAVKLTEVKGPLPSTRPWTRYEFADPQLQAASAGHKIMLRLGTTQQRQIKAKLRALRAELLRQGGA